MKIIMQMIEEYEDVVHGIKTAVKKIKSGNHTGLNFLLSDGHNLYAFRYSSCRMGYYSLYSLKRSPSKSGPFEIESQEIGALLHSKSLKVESVVLFCSEKLTKENWESISPGSLLIITPELNTKEVKIL